MQNQDQTINGHANMYHFVIYLINSVGLKICKSLCNRILKHSSNCHKLTNYALT